MTHIPYSYKRPHSERYTFISTGKKRIEKVVDFVPIGIKNIMNLGFGDLLPDGSVDDKANSNNGDIVKVLVTIVQIVRSLILQYPDAKIVFTGSTAERTKLYERIIKMYYEDFRTEFKISVLLEVKQAYKEEDFEPGMSGSIFAFFVKRN